MFAQHRQLTWTDRPFAELIRLAWPIAVSMVSYSLMTLAGTLFVGGLGPAALAGVGLGGTAAFVLLVFSFGLLRAVKTLVAQAVGAGRAGDAGAYLGAGLALAAAIGVATVVVGELIAVGIGALSASRAAGDHAQTYLAIRVLGAPLVLLYVALREARYGLGDSRAPMLASLAGNLVNIGLDALLVLGLDAGVAGAAWGTVGGHAVELALLVALRRPSGLGGTRAAHVAAVWRLGLPTAVQFAIEFGSLALLVALLAALGEVEMAAHQIALQVIHLSFLPGLAVAEAVSVLAGQAVGAGRDELVRPLARLGLVVTTLYTGVCTIAFAVGAGWIAALFDPTPELRARAIELLYVAAVFQMFDGANVIARGALRGAGDVRYPAVMGVITAWVFTPPLTWLLGYRAGLGALGGWIGLCLEIMAGAALFWWRLERGSWRRAAAAARALVEAGESNRSHPGFTPAKPGRNREVASLEAS